MKKQNKKIKIKKKDLDKFSAERIIGDFDSINSVISKIDYLDENLTEEDALQVQEQLHQIEGYLKNQYKDYIKTNINDVNLNDIEVDLSDDDDYTEESKESEGDLGI
tara:strand:+ start:250 stop:570 length:321 start_codon:yes stop_codon:yes gene_type:complete